MTVVPRLSSRARRRYRAAGASLAAAAVLPWLAVLPSAQAASDDETVTLCHATDSDSTPYDFLELPASEVISVHLEHRDNPTATWHQDTTFNGNLHLAGSPKPDIISDFGNYILDGVVVREDCVSSGSGGSGTTTRTTTTTTPPTSTTTTSTTITSTTTTSTTTTTPPTSTTTTTTTPPTTTSTTTPPTVTSTTSTTTPPTTTSTSGTTSPTETSTVLPTKATNTTTTSPTQGTEVLGENAALPRTGTDAGQAALLSLLLLSVGGVLLRVSGMRFQRARKH